MINNNDNNNHFCNPDKSSEESPNKVAVPRYRKRIEYFDQPRSIRL